MDENMERTPHPEEPAEGADDIRTPEHNTAPDGYAPTADDHGERSQDDLHGNAQGAAQGGAIQGDSSHGESPRGAIQGSADEDEAPLGGDQTTEDQLDSDNAVEDDTLRTLDPDDSPA
ncbi:hypothetical protein [Microbacterium sp. SD291]|uniref:hypothetical protein n=1 Tax=Microbacterium sp. SD291 TaxID=2782007 RepID=UPI001A969913|nr:hypothetical protein [Microbacterium sp. SD291]MBO0979695.1 hypothetical protein [Microbacterium sp. SD291]